MSHILPELSSTCGAQRQPLKGIIPRAAASDGLLYCKGRYPFPGELFIALIKNTQDCLGDVLLKYKQNNAYDNDRYLSA